MDKQTTVVRVAGKDYTLTSTDAPEYLQRVAAYADRTIAELGSLTRQPTGTVAILACLELTDQLLKAQDENSRLKREIEALHERALTPED